MTSVNENYRPRVRYGGEEGKKGDVCDWAHTAVQQGGNSRIMGGDGGKKKKKAAGFKFRTKKKIKK